MNNSVQNRRCTAYLLHQRYFRSKRKTNEIHRYCSSVFVKVMNSLSEFIDYVFNIIAKTITAFDDDDLMILSSSCLPSSSFIFVLDLPPRSSCFPPSFYFIPSLPLSSSHHPPHPRPPIYPQLFLGSAEEGSLGDRSLSPSGEKKEKKKKKKSKKNKKKKTKEDRSHSPTPEPGRKR